jgi:hypothetical protein
VFDCACYLVAVGGRGPPSVCVRHILWHACGTPVVVCVVCVLGGGMQVHAAVAVVEGPLTVINLCIALPITPKR